MHAGDYDIANSRTGLAWHHVVRTSNGDSQPAARPGRHPERLHVGGADGVGGGDTGRRRNAKLVGDIPPVVVVEQPESDAGWQVDCAAEIDLDPLADWRNRAALGPGRGRVAIECIDGVVLRGLAQPGAGRRCRDAGGSRQYGHRLIARRRYRQQLRGRSPTSPSGSSTGFFWEAV